MKASARGQLWGQQANFELRMFCGIKRLRLLFDSPRPTKKARNGLFLMALAIGSIAAKLLNKELSRSQLRSQRKIATPAWRKSFEQRRCLFAEGFDSQIVELWIFFYLRERFHGG